jgi:predicted porin
MFHHNRKQIAVLIVSAFAAPLAAQAEPNVTVYGKLYPEIVSTRLSGATATGTPVSTLAAPAATTANISAVSMDSPNSRLGFRGTEDLGGNLKAFFQLEIGFGVDTGANSSATSLFSRDTFVGMGGGFGSVKLGSMDTVYKNLGDTMPFLGVSSGNFISTSNILSKPGIGASSSSSFHLRRGNSIIYESPNFGGFQALFDYSLGEVAGDFTKGSVISTGVRYDAGPLYLALAHERHKDLFGGSRNVPSALSNASNAAAHSTDTATRLTAQYRFGSGTRAEVNLARLNYEETGGAAGKFSSYRHNAWSISGEQNIGAVTLVASYGQSAAGRCSLVGGVFCSTAGLDGKMLNLGASYSFSKRTSLFALYSKMRNGSSAVFNNLSTATLTTGQDISALALGISHSF